MQLRPLLHTLLGLALVITGSEIALREVEQHLPVLSHWPTLETEVKSTQFAELDSAPSLLLIGSSMTESGIDPQRLMTMGAAPSAYNSAFPFFSPAAAELWLREFLEPWDDLEVLLIGLPVWPPPRDTASDSLTLGLLRTASAESDSDPFDNLALWRLRGLLADIDEAARRDHSREVWTDLGHQTHYYGRANGSVAGNYGPYLYSAMSDVQERALRRIIETALDAEVTPIVLLEPGGYPDEVADQRVAAYIDSIRALAEGFGVEFWDSYSIDWDSSLYADETHFNRTGTIAFTDYVGERLIDLRNRSQPVAP